MQKPYQAPPKTIASIAGFGQLHYQMENEHQDSAAAVYYQSQVSSPKQMALYSLVNQLISAPFFYELRTKRQFGYSVGTGYMPLANYPGLLFYVQSNIAPPYAIFEAIDQFIDEFPKSLAQLSQSEWQQNKQALMGQIMDKDRSLQERSKRFWVSLGNDDTKFEQREKILEALEFIEKSEIMDFVQGMAAKLKVDRLLISATGNNHQNSEQTVPGQPVESVERFQSMTGRLTLPRTSL